MARTAPVGHEWAIRSTRRGQCSFDLAPIQSRVRPDQSLSVIDIPDAPPGIIAASTLNAGQALLALVRYNRLIDIFLGVTESPPHHSQRSGSLRIHNDQQRSMPGVSLPVDPQDTSDGLKPTSELRDPRGIL